MSKPVYDARLLYVVRMHVRDPMRASDMRGYYQDAPGGHLRPVERSGATLFTHKDALRYAGMLRRSGLRWSTAIESADG